MCLLFPFSHIEIITSPYGVYYERSGRGNKLLHHNGIRYIRNNTYGGKVYWKCTRWHSKCKARAITTEEEPDGPVTIKNSHNHVCGDTVVDPIAI